MPFPSALSGTNQTKYRNGTRSTLRYVVANTPTVIHQFNPNANADGANASQIGFSATLAGDYQDVLQYMSVYVTPTTDYVNDLQTQPENCLKTYVRKDPTSAILYIGLTAFQWTTSSYVTVVSNFEVFEKKTVVEGSTIFKDSDIVLRAPLPRIYGLYHDVVLASGSTYDYSPTPTEEAMSAGDSIASRTWAVIENGTVTKAVSTSATPTFTLDVGKHWLHLTTTDSNGNKSVAVAFVAVVPDSFASVISDMTCDTTTIDVSNGTSADIIAYADTGSQITTLVPGAFGIVFTVVNFTDNTSLTSVEMCGWFDAPVTLEYTGDEQFGVISQYRTSILGVREIAKAIRIPAFPFKYKATPSAWGHVTRCTVYDGVWYTLSEHSTITTVASTEFPSSYTDYQFNPSLQIPSGAIMDSVDAQVFRASGSMVNYAPNGELVFAQSAVYMTSGRDALTTYATYDASERDALRYGVTRPPVNRFTLSSVQAGLASWNTTTNTQRVYRSVAPANETPAALFEQTDGIIMAKNLTNANALIEAGKLTANHFFASNDSLQFDVDFVDGYLTIVPSGFQWHKFNVPSTALLDGSSFDSNTRFLCASVSRRYDAELGNFVITGTFREETDGGDNYARETQFIPTSTEQVQPVFPTGTYSPYLDDFDIQSASDIYGDEFDEYNDGIEDPSLPPEVAPQNTVDPRVLETLYVPFKGGAVATSFNTTLAADYLICVTGSARINTGSAQTSYDFTSGANGFTALTNADSDVGTAARPATGEPAAGSITGSGWTTADYEQENTTDVRAIYVHLDTSVITVAAGEGITATFDYTQGNHGSGFTAWRMQTKDSGGVWSDRVVTAGGSTTDGTDLTIAWSPLVDTDIYGIAVWIRTDNQSSPSGSALLKSIVISGGDVAYGDSFYTWTETDEAGVAYSGSDGLNQDGSGITHANAFSPESYYEYTATGTGNPFSFSYTDPDGVYTDNENKYIKVQVKSV